MQRLRQFMPLSFSLGIGHAVVRDEILEPQRVVGLVEFGQFLIGFGRILCGLLRLGVERGGVLGQGPAGRTSLLLDGLVGQPQEPIADREFRRPRLEPFEPLQNHRIDQIVDPEPARRHRSAGFEIGQFAPDGVMDPVQMILDQVEIHRPPVRLGRIACRGQKRADAAATGRALPVRFMLEARHIPVNPLAQVGKGLAQDRLDLEPLFLCRDHARGQLEAQADLDARLAARLGGDDFEPDEILAEAYKMRFKLPHLFLDDLRRALLAVPVEIAKCSDDFHAV
jgi:hypothetical protein